MKLKKILKIIILPAILFLGITFLINKDIVTDFSSNIEKNDGRLLAWTLAWDNHTLLTNPLNIFNANIFYPNENTLTYSEHVFGISLLSLPAYILSDGNPVIGFNFVMLLSYFLNAFFGYLLVRHLTKNTFAGIIGGIIFGFCSYRIISFAHLQNITVFYIPIMLLALYKYLENKKTRYLVIIGVALLFQSLSSWYHMVFIFLLLGIFLLYFLWRKKFNKKDIMRLGVTVGTVLILIIPFALPYLEFNRNNQSAYKLNELKTYSADFGGYLLPAPNTWISSNVFSQLNIDKSQWQENINFLGYSAIFLALLSFISINNNKISLDLKLDKKRALFLITGAVFFILSFGPFLRISDETTRIPLPYIVVYLLLPPIRFIRAVSRFSTVVPLMLGILAGFGFVKLSEKLKSKYLKYIAFAVISITLVFEYFPVVQFFQFTDVSNIPEIYKEIKKDSEVKAIIELPIDVGPFETTGYIYWAGYHLKPIVNGYSGYEPKDYAFIKNIATNNDADILALKLNDIGVTNIIVNPNYEKDLTSNYLEMLEEYQDGYKLYKINNINDKKRVYVDDFENKFNSGFEVVNFEYDNAGINMKSETTPLTNISPSGIGQDGNLKISTDLVVQSISLRFRAYSINDSIVIACGETNKYEFTNIDYLNKPYLMNCENNIINITLHSTEFKDRSMITEIILITDDVNQ